MERLMKKQATDTAFACKTCVHSAAPAESAPCNACVYGIFEHQFNNHAEATDSPTNEGYVRRGQPSDGPEKLASEKTAIAPLIAGAGLAAARALPVISRVANIAGAASGIKSLTKKLASEKSEIEETPEHHAKEQKAINKIRENAKRLQKLEDSEKKAEFDDGENGTGRLQALGKVVKAKTKLGDKFKIKTAAATYVGSATSYGTGRKKVMEKLHKCANMMMGYGGSTGAAPQMGTGRKIKMTKKAELFSKLAAGIPETPVTSNDEPGDLPLPTHKKKLHAKVMKKTGGLAEGIGHYNAEVSRPGVQTVLGGGAGGFIGHHLGKLKGLKGGKALGATVGGAAAGAGLGYVGSRIGRAIRKNQARFEAKQASDKTRDNLAQRLMDKEAGGLGSAIGTGVSQLGKLWGGRAGITGKLKGTANLAGRFAKAHPVATAAGIGGAGLAAYGAGHAVNKLTD